MKKLGGYIDYDDAYCNGIQYTSLELRALKKGENVLVLDVHTGNDDYSLKNRLFELQVTSNNKTTLNINGYLYYHKDLYNKEFLVLKPKLNKVKSPYKERRLIEYEIKFDKKIGVDLDTRFKNFDSDRLLAYGIVIADIMSLLEKFDKVLPEELKRQFEGVITVLSGSLEGLKTKLAFQFLYGSLSKKQLQQLKDKLKDNFVNLYGEPFPGDKSSGQSTSSSTPSKDEGFHF